MNDRDELVLQVSSLSKTFPGQQALIDVELKVRVGEVHALVGQNGSGKSTLIKILSGYHQADAESVILFNGEPLIHQKGIAFVHQDLALVPTLNSIENMALGHSYRLTRTGSINWRQQHDLTRSGIQEFGADFDLRVPVAQLSGLQRTILAMARAMGSVEGIERSLLVLDEPTASLPKSEVALLMDSIRRLSARGAGVLYVSHHLGEVFDVCDRVTVLRDGRSITTTNVKEIKYPQLVKLIVGHSLNEQSSEHAALSTEQVMKVDNLAGGSVIDLSFDVRKGEIVGLAGLMGSGREQVLKLLFGAIGTTGGRVHVDGRPLRLGSPKVAIDNGVALVPAERKEHGIFANCSVQHNISLPNLRPLLRRLVLSQSREYQVVQQWVERMDLHPANQMVNAGLLSGGNQQKVVLARWMGIDLKVLLLDEPTQGVDVGAKSAIHELLVEAAKEGLSIVVASSDAAELAAICDRVIVIHDGRLGSIISRDGLSGERIVNECVSSSADEMRDQ